MKRRSDESRRGMWVGSGNAGNDQGAKLGQRLRRGRNRLKLDAVASRQMQRTMYHDKGYPTAKSVDVLHARRGGLGGGSGASSTLRMSSTAGRNW